MHHLMKKAATIWSKDTGIDRNAADQVDVERIVRALGTDGPSGLISKIEPQGYIVCSLPTSIEMLFLFVLRGIFDFLCNVAACTFRNMVVILLESAPIVFAPLSLVVMVWVSVVPILSCICVMLIFSCHLGLLTKNYKA